VSKEHRHFIASTLLVAVSSFLSKILGFFRYTLLSGKFGATGGAGLTDSFSAAFRLPDIIFNLIAFGILSIVLIPYFSGLIKKDDFEKLNRSASGFINFFATVISLFLLIGFIIADPFVRNFLVKGWTDEANILLTVRMTRILFLQSLFMALSGIFGSFLNAMEKYLAYSLALLSYNLGIIFGIIFLTPYLGIEGAAWGAVIGSFMHFMIQFAGSAACGFRYSFSFLRFDKEIRQLIFIAVPRVITLSGEQLVKLFIVNFASFLFTGSIYIFDLTENYSMIAFSIIAVSISTTTFPVFSKFYAGGEFNEMLGYLLDKLRSLLFFILPVCLFMVICRKEIIELFLVYGKFTGRDADLTSVSLIYYMIGIPFFSLTMIITRFYYARKKSFLPMVFSLAGVFVMILGSWILSKYMDISGLSLGRSLGYIVQAMLLILFIWLLNRREKLFTEINFKPVADMAKLILINLLILIAGLLIVPNINFFDNSKINSAFILIFSGSVLGILYYAACFFMKIKRN